MKESFAAFTCTVMELLVDDAPAIGSDNNAFQNKVNKNKHNLLSVVQYSIMLLPIAYPYEFIDEGGKYDVLFLLLQVISFNLLTPFFVPQGQLREDDQT